jgi:hypothetical protein
MQKKKKKAYEQITANQDWYVLCFPCKQLAGTLVQEAKAPSLPEMKPCQCLKR